MLSLKNRESSFLSKRESSHHHHFINITSLLLFHISLSAPSGSLSVTSTLFSALIFPLTHSSSPRFIRFYSLSLSSYLIIPRILEALLPLFTSFKALSLVFIPSLQILEALVVAFFSVHHWSQKALISLVLIHLRGSASPVHHLGSFEALFPFSSRTPPSPLTFPPLPPLPAPWRRRLLRRTGRPARSSAT